jgi:hydrogenase maturation protein HypF
VAHFEELPLPGGAAAILKPWRTALGWGYALLGEEGLWRAARLLRSRAAEPERVLADEDTDAVRRQIDAGVNVPLTTSCGRLFDAVAALAGVRHEITYEGQAAIELEMTASGEEAARVVLRPYGYVIDGDVGAAAAAPRRSAVEWVTAHAAGGDAGSTSAVVRLAPLYAEVLGDLEAGATPGVVGARLHATIAGFVLEACRQVRAATGLATVALSGGVFQNRLLAGLCERELAAAGFEVLAAGLVPVNDGGVALGQAAVAGYTSLKRRGELD